MEAPGRDAADAAQRRALTCARLLENEERRMRQEELEGQSGWCWPAGSSPLAAEPAPTAPGPAPTTPAAAAARAGQVVEVRVNGLGGPLCSIQAGADWTVGQLKARVSVNARIPTVEQRLFCGGAELSDQDSLSTAASLSPSSQAGSDGGPAAQTADVSLLRADPEWQRSLDMVLLAGMQLAVVPDGLRADRSIVRAALRQNGRALEYAAEECRADRELVLIAVVGHGLSLEHASAELRGDHEVVLAAVRSAGLALQHAAPAQRASPEVVLAAVASCPQALQFAAPGLREDRDLVLRAVRLSGLALEFAADRLRCDRSVVLAAVEEDGLALEYASEDLRADRVVVRTAVMSNGLALLDAAEELKVDRALLAVARWG